MSLREEWRKSELKLNRRVGSEGTTPFHIRTKVTGGWRKTESPTFAYLHEAIEYAKAKSWSHAVFKFNMKSWDPKGFPSGSWEDFMHKEGHLQEDGLYTEEFAEVLTP